MLVMQKKYLSEETVFRHSETVVSPTKLVLHCHCFDTSCFGLHEDTGIGAAIFPSDKKYLSEKTLVEFLQGVQVASISNPLAPVK